MRSLTARGGVTQVLQSLWSFLVRGVRAQAETTLCCFVAVVIKAHTRLA